MKIPLVTKIIKLLNKKTKYNNVYFIVKMLLISFFLRLIMIIFLAQISQSNSPSTTEIIDQKNLFFLFLAVVFSPILETIIGQWLPISISLFFTKSHTESLILSTIFFSALHFYAGYINVLSILPLGFILSASFLLKRNESLWTAFWVTTLIHSMHNGIILLIYMLSRINS